jgi:fission process protein 1
VSSDSHGCAISEITNIRKPRALPAFTIHTAVKQAKKAFDKSSNVRLRAWGPTATGLAIVPALPYLFDHPVEVAADRAFEWVEHQLAKSDKGAGTDVD